MIWKSVHTVMETQLPLPLYGRGKVRDTYALGDRLLMVTTDRLSAFDVVLPTPIPDKGRVLTTLSAFWFRRFEAWMPHHLISTDWEAIADALREAGIPDGDTYRPLLEGRTMLVRQVKPFPVECVVRGYLAGSLWKEYAAAASADAASVELYGMRLPGGLRESDRLPQPLFTPATKAHIGHDENISFERMVQIVGAEVAHQLRDWSLRLYQEAVDYALARGIIIADTKFEFGCDAQGRILLIDEVLTPDSSRFWDAALYQPGRPQPSYDKQFVRDYLESIGWNKQPPAPALPPEIVQKTAEKYREACRRLTGTAI
jgi:phosphoribosylaminoimidazole-succinocarboxamide synthase